MHTHTLIKLTQKQWAMIEQSLPIVQDFQALANEKQVNYNMTSYQQRFANNGCSHVCSKQQPEHDWQETNMAANKKQNMAAKTTNYNSRKKVHSTT